MTDLRNSEEKLALYIPRSLGTRLRKSTKGWKYAQTPIVDGEYHVMRTRYSQYSPDHYMASHAGLMTHQLCSALNEYLMR